MDYSSREKANLRRSHRRPEEEEKMTVGKSPQKRGEIGGKIGLIGDRKNRERQKRGGD